MNRINSLVSAALVSLTVGLISFWLYQSHEETLQKQEAYNEELTEQKLQIAESLLNRNHPLKALKLLRNEDSSGFEDPLIRQKRLLLTVDAAGLLGDDSLLQDLYEFDPALFNGKETLALQVAARYLLLGEFAAFNQIKEQFKDGSKKPIEWQLLNADALALQDKGEEAKRLLESLHAAGEGEEKRRLKLAILADNEHPKVAFEYLSGALKNSPRKSDLHYYRGKLLENSPNSDLAGIELEQAARLSPATSFFKEELLEHDISQGKWADSYALLQSFPLQNGSSKMWIYALFFDKAYKPLAKTFASGSQPNDRLTPLLRYLLTLDRKSFWNEKLVTSQPIVSALSEQSPPTLWLHLISLLQEDKQQEALALLKTQAHMADFHPALYTGVIAALNYKLDPKQRIAQVDKIPELPAKTHPFLKQLSAKPYSRETEMLLQSQAAFPALFLAAGWNEAALQLTPFSEIPKELPQWVSFALTQAIKSNRSPADAITFALQQPSTPQLQFLIAELQLKNGEAEKGEAALAKLSLTQSPLGTQAAKLLTDEQLKKEKWEEARKALLSNTSFANSLEGQERLAKILIKLNQSSSAEEIYTKILQQSAEAKSYYAVKAFNAKNYPLALQLTQELLQKYPYREDLKEQLGKIVQATKK